MAGAIVIAQALWGTVVKQSNSAGIENLFLFFKSILIEPRFWAGGVLYMVALGAYFILLSGNRFFWVQVTAAAFTLLLSTLLAALWMHEKVTLVNFLGVIIVILGVFLLKLK